jgi:preprotein translocase subunit SecD
MKTTKTQICTLISVIIISGLFTVGNFVDIPALKSYRMSLGLDLQGGTDITLKVDTQDYINNYKKNAISDIKKSLFDEKIGYKNFQISQHSPSFEIREQSDDKKVKKILKKNAISFTQNGKIFTLDISAQNLEAIQKKVVEQSIEIIRKRVDEMGNKEISIHGIDNDKISLQIPGKNDTKEIAKLLNTQAKLTFHLMDETPYTNRENFIAKDGITLMSDVNSDVNSQNDISEDRQPDKEFLYAVKNEVIIDGADLEEASAMITPEGQAAVSFRFNKKASQTFADVTFQNIGRPFAIVLDGKVLSAPNIKEPITGGSGVISGSFDTKTANELALLLRAGALPAKIEIVQQQNISATLGMESIIMAIKSMIVGVILVCSYMFYRYKALAFTAIASLVVNMLCVIAFLSIFGSTLTLPGIAGLILTVGMAVDGNIIIFENIKSLQSVLHKQNVYEEGFSRATPAIVDANITTILGAVMLYEFGFGVIRGFALTLIIGVIFSIFSSLYVTKILMGMKKFKIVA